MLTKMPTLVKKIFKVYIDSNGDAEGNYTLIALQDKLYDDGSISMEMKPVAYFSYINHHKTIPELKYIDESRPINWIKNHPPYAEPRCGFYGELCSKQDWKYALIGSCVAFLIIIAGAFLFKYNFKTIIAILMLTFIIFRHYRYEQKLACLLWKVDMKEVTVITTENVESSIRTKSLV